MTVEEQLTKAEELLQELADAIKRGDEVSQPWGINELHYKVVSFLSRPGRIYP